MLWVTTTEFASVKDSLEAMRALKMLSYSQERVRIVMNAISPDDGVRPSVVQDALQRDVFWNIPYDKKVRQGTHLGQPIVDHGAAVGGGEEPRRPGDGDRRRPHRQGRQAAAGLQVARQRSGDGSRRPTLQRRA